MFKIPQDMYCTNPWSEQREPSERPNIFCTNYDDLIVTSMECWELDLGNHPLKWLQGSASDSARNVGDVRKHVASMMIFHWSLYSQMYCCLGLLHFTPDEAHTYLSSKSCKGKTISTPILLWKNPIIWSQLRGFIPLHQSDHMKSMALADAGLRIGQVLSLGTVFMTGFPVAARVNWHRCGKTMVSLRIRSANNKFSTSNC